jgi:hypothetical protein
LKSRRIVISLTALFAYLAAMALWPLVALAQTTPTPTTTSTPGRFSDWTSWILLAVVIVALFWILGRGRRRGGTSPNLESAIRLMSNINDNLKIMRMHMADRTSTKKFKTLDWSVFESKAGFLDQPTVDALKSSYYTMNELNTKIDDARRTKNTALLQELPVDKLNEPLTAAQQGVQKWLRDNIQTEMSSRRGIFG